MTAIFQLDLELAGVLQSITTLAPKIIPVSPLVGIAINCNRSQYLGLVGDVCRNGSPRSPRKQTTRRQLEILRACLTPAAATAALNHQATNLADFLGRTGGRKAAFRFEGLGKSS
jgi:hypothetical protein